MPYYSLTRSFATFRERYGIVCKIKHLIPCLALGGAISDLGLLFNLPIGSARHASRKLFYDFLRAN